MKDARVVIDMDSSGTIDLKSSITDAGLVMIMLEKAKQKLLDGVQFKAPETIIKPRFKI